MKRLLKNIIPLIPLISFISLIFIPLKGNSQQTIIHDIPWHSDTVNMWGPYDDWSINQIDTLFEISVGPYGGTYSYVYQLPWPIDDSVGIIFDWGAYAYIQCVFEMTGWHSGSVYVNYPTKITMTFPIDGSFTNGGWITITSEYREQDTTIYVEDWDKWRLYARWPEAGVIRLYFNIDLDANMDLYYSDFADPFNITWDTFHIIDPVDIHLDTFEVFLIDVPNAEYIIPWVAYHYDAFGNPVIDSVYLIHDSLGWPIQFPPIFYDLIGITGDISIPQMENYQEWIENEQRLYAHASDEYLHINLDIIKFIQVMCNYLGNVVPQLEAVSQALEYEEGDTSIYLFTDPISGEDFTFDIMWDLIDAELRFTNTMHQFLAFCDNKEYYDWFGNIIAPPYHYPNVWNILEFPEPLEYRVYDTNYIMIEQGVADSIKYCADYEVELKYPCFEYDTLPITTTHTIDPWFTNIVKDSINVEFYLKLLEIWFSFGTQSNPIYSLYYLAYLDSFDLGTLAGPPLFGPPLFMPWQLDGYFPDTTFIPDVQIIPDYDPIQIDTILTNNVFCYGYNTGLAAAIVSGGVGPYVYVWTNGIDTIAYTATISNLVTGTYYITVTDANLCTVTDSITITNVNPEISISFTITDFLCYGENTGQITALVSGGTPPFSYLWSPTGGTNPTATGLYAGTYTLTVTDSAGCTETDTATIIQPDSALSISIVNTVDILCNGGNNGSIDIAVSGGTPPYSYQWSNGQTTQDINNLTAGDYTVIVTDANNCTISTLVTITEPAELTANITGTNISCYGETDGEADFTVTGGTPPYSYQWSNGAITEDINNLPAGIYTATVTDANSCTATVSVIIVEPPLLTATIVGTNVNCYAGYDGSADLTVSGGTPPYSYQWSNGATTEDLINIPAGIYTVIVTDNNGCTASAAVIISQPASALYAYVYGTDVTCYGGTDGAINLVVSGGTPPYSYQWSNGATTEDLNNIPEGNYSVIVTDANGCTITKSITITQPTELIVGVNDVSICYGQTATLFIAQISGGIPPYTYTWSTGEQGSIIVVSPTATTTYQVYATDANGCQSNIENVIVTVTPQLQISIFENTDTICYGDSVIIEANITGGGGPPYTVYLNTGVSGTPPLTIYPSYTQTIIATVKDTCNFAFASDSITITVLPLPTINISAEPASGCEPLRVEFFELSPDNGQTYLWNFGDGDTSSLKNPVHIYMNDSIYDVTLTIISPNGCINSLTYQNLITVYPLPVADFEASLQHTSILESTVQFYNYSSDMADSYWNFGDGQMSTEINPAHTYENVGTYLVTLVVVSEYGCKDTAYGNILIEEEITFYAPNAFTPDNNGINDIFIPKGTGIDPDNYLLIIFDRWGGKIFQTTNLTEGWDGTKGDRLCPQGVYTWVVKYKDIEGRKHKKLGSVTLIKK